MEEPDKINLMSEKVIGIDIGATKTRIGIVKDSVIIKEKTFPTSSDASKEKIIEELALGIKSLAGNDFAGIGIGVPGLIDEKKGVIFDLLNIPSWKEVHLKDYLEDFFKKPVRITNDANVFAIGEKMFGLGKSFHNFVGVTLGTGFGCGIIIHDKLYSGAYSSAGEFGNIAYLDKTIEDYCSGKFFIHQYGLSGAEAYKLVSSGDERGKKMFAEYGKHLGEALKLILNILSPQAILLGGSISKSFHYFEESLQDTMDSFPFSRVRQQLVIKPSKVQNMAILGAAALILSSEPELLKPQ